MGSRVIDGHLRPAFEDQREAVLLGVILDEWIHLCSDAPDGVLLILLQVRLVILLRPLEDLLLLVKLARQPEAFVIAQGGGLALYLVVERLNLLLHLLHFLASLLILPLDLRQALLAFRRFRNREVHVDDANPRGVRRGALRQ